MPGSPGISFQEVAMSIDPHSFALLVIVAAFWALFFGRL